MNLVHGDCIEAMAGMDPESFDAVVTDPPYGLEFMGKEWDKLDGGLPQEKVWKGRRGKGGSSFATEPNVAFKGTVRGPSFGGGQQGFKRCSTCGKRAFSGSPCVCPEPTWVIEYSQSAPTGSIRMQRWHQQWAEAAYRVAKPSAYLLAFGGTRTVHRMTVALEDAGWIIRDMLVWAYASGFPKSRASLKPSWEPIVLARKPGPLRELNIEGCRIVSGPTAIMDAWENEPSLCVSCAEDVDSQARPGALATRASTTRRRAEQQPNDSATSGGTSRAATGCSHGMTPASGVSSSSTGESGRTPTGLFPLDTSSTISTRTSSTTGSRTCTCCGAAITPTTTSGTRFDIETERQAPTTSGNTGSAREPSRAGEASAERRYVDRGGSDFAPLPGPRGGSPVGRWPSNLVLTDPIFDGGIEGVVGGGVASNAGQPTDLRGTGGIWHEGNGVPAGPQYGDSGTYSRFFLIPKADRADREPVLGGQLPRVDVFRGHQPDNPKCLTCGRQRVGPLGAPACDCEVPAWAVVGDKQRENSHPTVKPVDLMRHLVRLVTPTGGIVLDPFLGSGTTALACEMEGFGWVGIEREAEYIQIAEARLNGVQRGLGLEAS